MDLRKAYQRVLHNTTTINCPVELLIEPIFFKGKLHSFTSMNKLKDGLALAKRTRHFLVNGSFLMFPCTFVVI